MAAESRLSLRFCCNAGLLFRFTRPLAVAGLVILLVAMFPANIKAAREKLGIHGKPVSPLLVKGAIGVWCEKGSRFTVHGSRLAR
jgi:uncharacterized membrane protein